MLLLTASRATTKLGYKASKFFEILDRCVFSGVKGKR